MRLIYKAMQTGKHCGNYKDLTEEQISWWATHGLDLKGKVETEEKVPEERPAQNKYQEAYLLWKEKHPEERFVPHDTTIELPNGKKVFLGRRIYVMQSVYRAMRRGNHYGTYKDLTEEEIAWWTEHGFSFEKVEEIKSKNPKRETKRKRKNQNKETIQLLLSEFHIDFQEFIQSINLAKAKTAQGEGTFQENIEEQTLKQLCIQGHYNYNIIFSAVKLHSLLPSENLEALIKRITFSMQNKEEIPSWIFEVYGPMIQEVLLALGLRPKSIFKDMSNHIVPLEKAICNDIFSNTCKRHECDYLEDIYKKILIKINFQASEEENAEEIVNLIVKTGKRNHLMDDEIQVLKECFINYLKTLREYQIIDVGLEENEEKFRKIQKYNLTEEEIEESYFVPFRFESGAVLEDKNELYERRELLRQYIIDWDYYTEEEKMEAKEEHHFTERELSLMNQTRNQINEMIKKMTK